MAQYNRQSTFLPDEVLTAEQLEDEFNAIQAAINDIDSRVGNVEGGGLIVYNAADPEFAPLGSESFAARVANAIQAALAVDARSRVVWVPKSMWGYSADPDFSLTMFDPAVLVVREGALKPWYDPVAYGADISGTEPAHEIIQLCIQHAAQAAGPGSRVVALTVAGDYLLDDDVTHDPGVGFVQLPGVTFSGDGSFLGDSAWRFPGLTQLYANLLITHNDLPNSLTPLTLANIGAAIDPFGMWDSNEPTKITVPAGHSGVALVLAEVGYTTQTAGKYELRIHKNGGALVAGQTVHPDLPAGFQIVSVMAAMLTTYQPGDNFEAVSLVPDGGVNAINANGALMFFGLSSFLPLP